MVEYFTQIPELRAIFMLLGTIYGCVLDGEKYPGRVEHVCLMGGQGYIDMCGPRGYVTDLMSDSEWRTTYTLHRRYKDTMVQHYAGRFSQLSREEGGGGGLGYPAQRLATLWFDRDVSLKEDQAAAFFRGVCKQMRQVSDEDGGPEHTLYQPGSIQELSMGFVYET
tara:strand:+ start:38 stop:535 length:498 start_codon:yes stop_codon:yes gene_type:complete